MARNTRFRTPRMVTVVGHVHKKLTTEHWARQYCRQGKGQMIEGVLHCFRSGVTDGSLYRVLLPHGEPDGIQMEYRHRQSGDYGPIVVQGEAGNAPLKNT